MNAMTVLEKALKSNGMTVTQLADAVRCPKSSMSLYVRGKITPSEKRLDLIAEVLGVDPEKLMDTAELDARARDPDVMSVEEAAKAMSKSCLFVRLGLQRGILPFGYAVKTGEKHYSYFISRKKFTECTGIDAR